MVTFNKGSPETDRYEQSPNYMDINGPPDIDDNDEEGVYAGYEPLGMQDYEEMNVESDEEEHEDTQEVNNTQDSSVPQIEPIENELIREVWSAPASGDIPLDENKIDEIKQLMKGITLPVGSMPDWVNNEEIVNSLIHKTKQSK
ncbi:uncharacterized protein LOC109609418 [Aethina tumida]|uniref:uncharacterized protein LOC109609418 n=1 Tax=Aethina tumida TaxID=116153 RepID=UPI00096AE665|nr:uncharacterized protein LOC109609418 [Aethina tumida]